MAREKTPVVARAFVSPRSIVHVGVPPPRTVPLSWLSVRLRDDCDLRDVNVTHHWANISFFYF